MIILFVFSLLEGIYSSPILHILIFFPIVSFSFLHLSCLHFFSVIPLLSFQSTRFLQTYGNSLNDEPSETVSCSFYLYLLQLSIFFYHALQFLQDLKIFFFSRALFRWSTSTIWLGARLAIFYNYSYFLAWRLIGYSELQSFFFTISSFSILPSFAIWQAFFFLGS